MTPYNTACSQHSKILFNTQKAQAEKSVFESRSRRRASQPESGEASLVFEPEARCSAPGELRRAPIPARSAGSRRRLRGVLSFGSFSLHEQRKGTCRGSATHKLYVAAGDTKSKAAHRRLLISSGGLRQKPPNPPYIKIISPSPWPSPSRERG